MIFVSQTPDYILPATSCVLHGTMGLKKNCVCLDISLGCSGRKSIIGCSFGVGLSWGTVAFDTDNLILSNLVEL